MAGKSSSKPKKKAEPKRKRETSATPPAQGERNAKGGLRAQDRFSAQLVLKGIKDGTLLAIRVADPTAGRVDDFQILTDGRTDAYQVKWEIYPGYFSINELLKKDKEKEEGKEKPSLINQLADGWKKIKAQKANSRVVVHLATNARPSTKDRALPEGSPTGNHLAAFMAECWEPLKKQSLTLGQIPAKWATWMLALEKESGLSNDEFANFIADCEFDFDSRLEKDVAQSSDEAAGLDEIDEIAQFLLKTVASAERVVELSRDDLIRRLGWEDAVNLRNVHGFPVDERTYQPVRQTEMSLATSIQQFISGYVCVLGTPGSGKSTLLAKTFAQRPERVLRYFAYVPGISNAGSLRGESDNFLHDMVLALERQGIYGDGSTVKKADRLLLQKHWASQLRQLHEEYVAKGRKTIIVIDGLDHIDREQHPHHSLLNDLLAPDAVPQGVVFVLGSQSASFLQPRIKHQLDEAGRTIVMNPLTRDDVDRILIARELNKTLNSSQQDRVYELSAGHPLALDYIVNKLKEMPAAADIVKFLNTATVFAGDIEANYVQYWHDIVDQDRALIPVLGLISRMRGYVDLTWLDTWDEKEAVARFVEKSAYLFRRETPTRWHIFHNSFRLFLVRRTAHNLADQYSEAQDQKYHSTLADRCQLATAPEHWKWEELYHRSMAKEHKQVLALTDQNLIRSQFFTFRSPSLIHGDLVLASQSLPFVQDGVAAVRISLAMFEIERRRFALDMQKAEVVNILIRSGSIERAMGWINDNTRILVISSNSLGYVQDLAKAGHREEAKRIFDQISPSSYTEEPMGMNQEDSQLNDLAGWYFAARVFEPVEVCLETLRPLRFKAAELGRRASEYADDAQNAQLHVTLLGHILQGCIYRRKWDDAEKIIPLLPQNDPLLRESRMMMVEAYLDDGNADAARLRLEELIRLHPPQSQAGIVRVAESYARLGEREKVLEYFARLTRPALVGRGMDFINGFNSFDPLFRYDRLAFYCNPATKWTSLVPDDAARNDGSRLFQKALCSVAQIGARAWRKEATTLDAYQVEIGEVLRFYHRDLRTMEDWDLGSEIRYSRSNLYSLLAEACAAHGPLLIKTLTEGFDQVWGPEGHRYWPLENQTEIVVQLAQLGADSSWAKKWLTAFEGQIELGVTADTYVHESVRQAGAWLEVGENTKALLRTEKVLQRSFGIADRKDYQLSTWIELFGELAGGLPGQGLSAIIWFAKCIRGLEEGVSSRAASDAAADLIEVCVRHHPEKAFALFAWFQENECIWYEQALRSMLKPGLKDPGGDLVLKARIIREVLIPVSTKAAPWLIREFLRQIGAAWSADEFNDFVQSLCVKIKTFASAECRNEWLLGVGQAITDQGLALATFGLNQSVLRHAEPHASSDKLNLKDGTVEHVPDMATRVRNVAEVVRLQALESDQSYFKWHWLVAAIAPHLQADELLRIVDLFKDDDDFAQICQAASQRLVDLGKAQEAWALGEKAEEKSISKTWLPYMDGGPRLSAFLTLLRADAVKGRLLLFKAFGVDGPPATENIRVLLPYLVEPQQYPDLWRELENHLRALLEGTDKDPAEPNLNATPAVPVGDPSLIELLLHNLGHPATVLMQTAQKTLAPLILLDHAPSIEAVKKSILPNSSTLPELIEVVVAVALVSLEKCEAFRPELLASMESNNLEARALCLEVAWRCDWREFAVERPLKPLPPIYQLELPETSSFETRLIEPYDDLVSLISENTGLAEENLIHRLLEIARSIEVNKELSPGAEQKMASRLESWGLRVKSLKPRVRLVKRALFILLGELADAGGFPTTPYSNLPAPFRDFDPFFLLVDPSVRPSMIPPRIKDGYVSYDEEWARGPININDHVPVREPSGWIIIGSEACFRAGNDTRATERTFTVLRPTNAPIQVPSWPSQYLFKRVSLSSVEEYHDYKDQWDGKRLVIESNPLVDGPGSPFLALHPDVARQMGWQPQLDGLLAWTDKTGQTIVESRWWQDGPVSVSNLHSDIEIADGWYVAMGPGALAALETRFGPLSRIIRGQRSTFRSAGLIQGPILNQTSAF